jgi:hypothetical protein
MRLFGIVFVAAAMLALPAGASARPAGRVLVRTPTHITQM